MRRRDEVIKATEEEKLRGEMFFDAEAVERIRAIAYHAGMERAAGIAEEVAAGGDAEAIAEAIRKDMGLPDACVCRHHP